jgi:hypothetical protein
MMAASPLLFFQQGFEGDSFFRLYMSCVSGWLRRNLQAEQQKIELLIREGRWQASLVVLSVSPKSRVHH